MKKLSLLLTVFCLLAYNAVAQQLELIKFEKIEHDFGVQKEEDENATYAFKFKNTTDKPVKLISVKASCGCTTPTWTKEEIKPGQSGFVEAKYGMRNRPGKFDKAITVRAAKIDNIDDAGEAKDAAQAQTLILKIKGDVTPRPKGPADWYPFEDGALRYSTNHAAFGDITNNEVKTKEFVIYNQGTKTINISKFESKPHIKYEFVGAKSVKPKDSIKVKVTYDAKQVNDFDFLHERSQLTTDDSVAVKTLYVSANVKEYFPTLTPEELAKAPKIEFNQTTYNYGTIKEGEKASTEYVFRNTGKSDLQIRKSKASCGCTAAQPTKMLLKPGEEAVIKVTFDSTGKPGKQSKQITVVSNDPVNPVTKLTIEGQVDKKEDGHDPNDGHDHSGHNH